MTTITINRLKALNEINVQKRTGTVVTFDKIKINNAIMGAFREHYNRDLSDLELMEVNNIATSVVNIIRGKVNGKPVDIEEIQDIVESQLMSRNHYDVAKRYILYREHKKQLRSKRLRTDGQALSDYVHLTKYARYRPDLGRRELFHETVERVRQMHLERYPELVNEINWAFEFVKDKRVLPSMRSMQYAGAAINQNHVRIYNCASSQCNRIRFFQESLFLLLSGVGVGYSIQFHHVDQLPKLATEIDEDQVVHHIIGDTIEGWCDAVGALFDSYVNGYCVEFSYHEIRPLGAPLKTSGGRAPGHLPLKKALDKSRIILHNALGRKLRPIECHDIMCNLADAVLSGGNRESAMIALFSPGDWEMVSAKTGDWYSRYPQRARANNSMVLLRNESSKSQLKDLFRYIKQWGEPGFYFTDDPEVTTNPCVEISMRPIYEVSSQEDVKRIKEQHGVDVELGSKHYGHQVCNLTEINAAKFTSFDDMKNAAAAAAIIGTLQAGYTDFSYLGWVSEEITRREALLGVSMTGMMDKPDIALDADNQKKAAEHCIEVNKKISNIMGINPASRVTCVKPSGSTSLVFGSVGSGIHPHHARRYFRRVKTSKQNAVLQFFRQSNEHMVEPVHYNQYTDCITFCVEAPDGAVIKADIGAIQFLEMVRNTQINWVKSGTARPETAPDVNHNVSNTCFVRPDEWEDVMDYIWQHRSDFTGISLLSSTGDKDYAQAPFEAVTTDNDELKWNNILEHYQDVDYAKMVEIDDNTDLSGEIACSGGKCEL